MWQEAKMRLRKVLCTDNNGRADRSEDDRSRRGMMESNIKRMSLSLHAIARYGDL